MYQSHNPELTTGNILLNIFSLFLQLYLYRFLFKIRMLFFVTL